MKLPVCACFLALLLHSGPAGAEPPPPPAAPPAPSVQTPEESSRYRITDRWVEKMEKDNPSEIERLKKLHREDPDKFREEMRARFEKFREDMKKRNTTGAAAGDAEARPAPASPLEGVVPPELLAIERELRDIVKEYRKAGEADRPALEKKAQELAGRIFDYRMAERRKRIELLSKELEKLQAAMNREVEGRDEAIRRRLKLILSGSSERSGERHERGERPAPPSTERSRRGPDERREPRNAAGAAA